VSAWVRVFDLDSGEHGDWYSCPPRAAVIAAHANSLNDRNSWAYAERYKDLVVEGDGVVRCGNFSAITSKTPPLAKTSG
jgi:hypothetical protein